MRKMMYLLLTVGLLLSAVMLLQPVNTQATTPSSETNQDLLLIAKQGVDNAVSAIRSGKGSTNVTFWSIDDMGRVTETETSYNIVFEGDTHKYSVKMIHVTGSGSTTDEKNVIQPQPGMVFENIVSYDGERLVRFDPGSGRATSKDPHSSQCDLNNYKLDADIVGAGLRDCRRILFDSADTNGITALGKELNNGDECIVLEAIATKPLSTGEQSTKTVRFWVDPQNGFTVTKVQRWAQGGRFRDKILYSQMEIEARQYQGGVWGLAKATYDEFDRKGKDGSGEYYRKIHQVVTVDPEFELNATVKPEDIELKLPSGTKVEDLILQTEYIIP